MTYDTTIECPFCSQECVFTWEEVSRSFDHDGYEILRNIDVCRCAEHSESLEEALRDNSASKESLFDWAEAAFEAAERLGVPASDPRVIKEVTAWLSNE